MSRDIIDEINLEMKFGIWEWNGIWDLEMGFGIWEWDLTPMGFGILPYPNNMDGKYIYDNYKKNFF